MSVIEQRPPEPTALEGVAHATWAGQAQGLQQLSVWRQSLAPGAGTPPHQHDCDEVVICLGGEGELHADGQREPNKGVKAGTISDSSVTVTAKAKGYVMTSDAQFNETSMRLHSVISVGNNPAPALTFDAKDLHR